ncbi:hypothetical protein [Chitinophaga flava]|uniref:Uncharacterized protein n=1 Tax=Chitinophaga flava TaxID=2259036 RepID=A0A365XWH2_9BACT|nr:hypothetical protein [Chitinophaga flava]RBL90693.1 hypothetical protein DF182_30060 [Chitinophaga flava]
MKKLFFSLVAGGVLVSNVAISNVKVNPIVSPTYVSVPQQVYFQDTEEFLDQYDALLSKGNVYTLALEPGKGIYIVGVSSRRDQGLFAEVKHDYSSKDKLAFAKWCDKQISAGKKLTIGKDADGTYWADVVK